MGVKGEGGKEESECVCVCARERKWHDSNTTPPECVCVCVREREHMRVRGAR